MIVQHADKANKAPRSIVMILALIGESPAGL